VTSHAWRRRAHSPLQHGRSYSGPLRKASSPPVCGAARRGAAGGGPQCWAAAMPAASWAAMQQMIETWAAAHQLATSTTPPYKIKTGCSAAW
jgi:hypothetical protein